MIVINGRALKVKPENQSFRGERRLNGFLLFMRRTMTKYAS